MDQSYALHVLANVRQYQSEFAKLPGYTEQQASKAAEKLALQLSRGQGQAAAAARKAAGQAGDAWKDLGDSGGAAGQAGAKLAGILEATLGPAAANASRFVNDLGDSLEVGAAAAAKMPVAVAAVAGALTIAAGAYVMYKREADRVLATRASEQKIAESLRDAESALVDARRDSAVALGQMTEQEGKALAIRTSAARAVLAYAGAQQEQRRELLETIAATEAWADSQRSVARGMAAVWTLLRGGGIEDLRANAAAIEDTIDQMTGWKSGIEFARAELLRLDQAVVRQAALQKEIRDATITADAATRMKTASDKAAAAALKEQEEAQRRALSALEAYYTGLNVAREAERAAQAEQLDGLARLAAKRDETLYDLAQKEMEAVDANLDNQARLEEIDRAFAAARAEVWKAYQADKAELEADDLKKAREKAEEEIALEREVARSRLQARQESIAAAAQLVDTAAAWTARAQERLNARLQDEDASLTEAQRDQLEKRLKGAKRMAIAAFVAQRAAAVAQAFIATQLAAAQALAVPPAPNFVLQAAALVAGGLQTAAVAAAPPPKFHTGTAVGVRGPGTGEVAMIGQEGELVVRRDAARRPGVREAVGRMNAGMDGGGGQPIIVDRYGGRLWARSIRDAARLGPATTQIGRRSAGRVGHSLRERR